MNVFVLSAGRCGTTTIAKALEHCTSHTVGHESRSTSPNVLYPDDHIEVDNRLSFRLGPLMDVWGDKAFFVHLYRDDFDAWVNSFMRRDGRIIGRAWHQGVLMRPLPVERSSIEDYLTTTDANIHDALSCLPESHERRISGSIETISSWFPIAWERASLRGDLKAATEATKERLNSS